MATMKTETQETVLKGPIPESGVYVDPDLMVDVFLQPNENRDEGEQFEIVSVNGKQYQIRLGVPAKVPYPVFEALYNSGRFKSL